MSLFRRAAKVDTTQAEVIAALDKAGVRVWNVRFPCDLLVHYVHPLKGWTWAVLEVKSLYGKKNPKPRIDPRQKVQAAFIRANGVPIVTNGIEALEALGLA